MMSKETRPRRLLLVIRFVMPTLQLAQLLPCPSFDEWNARAPVSSFALRASFEGDWEHR